MKCFPLTGWKIKPQKKIQIDNEPNVLQYHTSFISAPVRVYAHATWACAVRARVHMRRVHIRLYLYLLSLYKTQELKEWGGRTGIQSPEYEC